jgi:hypothetical protein
MNLLTSIKCTSSRISQVLALSRSTNSWVSFEVGLPCHGGLVGTSSFLFQLKAGISSTWFFLMAWVTLADHEPLYSHYIYRLLPFVLGSDKSLEEESLAS